MNPITYDNVLPLVQNTMLRGRILEIVFACPASGRRVRGSAGVEANSKTSLVVQRAKRAALFSLRGPIASAVRSAFGSSPVGRMLGDVASTTAYVATTPTGSTAPVPTEEEKQAAVVAAFESISDQFEWDPAMGWILAPARQVG